MPFDINTVSVTFENGVKREEYGPTRKASVTITAAVGEHEDGALVLDGISQIALLKVALLLDAPKPTALATTPAQAAEDEAAAGGQRRRGRPPKTQEPPADETQSDGPPADDDWSSAPPEVTDEILLKSLSARAQALGDAKRPEILRLIGSFNPKPNEVGFVFKAQDIPQAQRQDFLDKLAALT